MLVAGYLIVIIWFASDNNLIQEHVVKSHSQHEPVLFFDCLSIKKELIGNGF
jgi:hypothetical protein